MIDTIFNCIMGVLLAIQFLALSAAVALWWQVEEDYKNYAKKKGLDK